MTRLKWPGLIALTILVTRATTFLQPLIDDEETFAVFGRMILHGGLPYTTLVDNKPPLLYYWYALWMGLFGETNTAALHAVGIFWVALTCYFIYRIGSRMTTQSAGYFAALAYAIFSAAFVPATIALHASLILALPLSISIWAFIRWADTRRIGWMLLAGLCCGTAVFFKFQALVQIPLILCAVIFVRPFWKATLAFLAGAAAVVVAVIAFLHHHHIAQEFYEATWLASMTYMKQGGSAGDLWHRFMVNAGGYIAATSLLWIAAATQLRRKNMHFKFLIWGWLLASIPAVLAGGRYYGHYFIQLLPPLCILAGAGLDRWWQKGRGPRIALATFLTIIAVGWMIPRIWYAEFAARYHLQTTRVEQLVGTYIKEKSPTDSTLFVWGVEPSIYFFAERMPATRFLWSDWLVGRLPGVTETQKGNADTSQYINPEAWTQFMSDIERSQPYFIVDCAAGNLRNYGKFPIQNYPLFYNFLQKNYQFDATIDGVIIYRHR